jgi:predicted NBD/HSP70 family sugar kinase
MDRLGRATNEMMALMKGSRRKARRVLVVDVGGSHVKMRIGTRGAIREFKSGRKLRAAQMVEQVLKLTRDWRYDVVSIGFPGIVIHGRIAAEPHNLGSGWLGCDFRKGFDKPVRVINDAAMQAMGSYEGGRMLFLGLGTGLGVTLILDGVVEPMELGHMLYRHGRTYEDYVGERGYRRLGTKKWRKVVDQVVTQLRTVLEADYVVLGGGNVKKLKTLPQRARRGDNRNAFIGGVRLWARSTQRLQL